MSDELAFELIVLCEQKMVNLRAAFDRHELGAARSGAQELQEGAQSLAELLAGVEAGLALEEGERHEHEVLTA